MKSIADGYAWRRPLTFCCALMLLPALARAEDPVLVDIRSEIGGEALAGDVSEQDTEDALRRFLSARIEQSGSGNMAAITQAGRENYALIQQGGVGGDASIIQSGAGNHAVIVQR